MKDEIQEEYVFYRLSHSDFEECCAVLDLLPKVEDNKVILALIKYTIVSYYRPFSGSNPVHRQRKWKLPESLITDLRTHRKVEEFRLHLVAHTDLEYKRPHLSKIGEIFPISFKGVYFEDYVNISKPLRTLSHDMAIVMSNEIQKYEKENFLTTRPRLPHLAGSEVDRLLVHGREAP
jgi:hypothetical protein